MRCSVCVRTYKRPHQLNRLLASLIVANDTRQMEEIIVAVTGGMEDSTDTDTLHLLRMMELRGISHKVLHGLTGMVDATKAFKAEAGCDVILMVDDDMLIGSDYFDLSWHFLDKGVGAVAGSMQTPIDIGHYRDWSYDAIDNPSQELVNRIEIGEDGLISVADKYQVYMLEKARTYHCQCLAGGAVFLRRDAIETDSHFNDGASVYEDFDMTYSMYRRGYKVLYDSSRVCYHLRAETGGAREKSQDKQMQRIRNTAYMRDKYAI